VAFVRRLKDAVERLKDFPELGGPVPEAEETGHREIVHGNHRIIYRYSGRTVRILAVWHGAKPLGEGSLTE
jgi:plasmid stabilization system protein ParE